MSENNHIIFKIYFFVSGSKIMGRCEVFKNIYLAINCIKLYTMMAQVHPYKLVFNTEITHTDQ